jgi:dolichol-phosphate mannosyltransferase
VVEATLSDRLLVFVCTYNERANLPRLVEDILTVAPLAQLLVIDDGSPDGTGQWAADEAGRRPSLHLMQRGAKLGLGTAIKAGLTYALEQGYDYAINLDADYSHDPSQIPVLLGAAIESQADLVIGSRYVEGGGLRNCSWRRHLVSRAANIYARAIVGWKIRDCSSAYRCYRVAGLRRVELSKIECVGYGFLEEILWAILRSSGIVIERPIIYTEREHGESKISLKEATGTLGVLHRLALSRFRKSSRVKE